MKLTTAAAVLGWTCFIIMDATDANPINTGIIGVLANVKEQAMEGVKNPVVNAITGKLGKVREQVMKTMDQPDGINKLKEQVVGALEQPVDAITEQLNEKTSIPQPKNVCS